MPPATYLVVPQAGGAFGAAGSEVQDGFSPMAHALLHQGVYRIDLHALHGWRRY
jgi:hypothetical protein